MSNGLTPLTQLASFRSAYAQPSAATERHVLKWMELCHLVLEARGFEKWHVADAHTQNNAVFRTRRSFEALWDEVFGIVSPVFLALRCWTQDHKDLRTHTR